MATKHDNEEWKATFDCINDGIFFLSPDQKILRSNRYMRDLLGKSEGELVGRHCYEVLHKTDCPVEGCPVEKMKRTLSRETMDLQIGDRWFNVTADPRLDEKGGLRGVLHIVRDITENRNIKEALHSREELYRTLAEASPEMIYLINPDGIIRYVNTTASKMFHAPASAVIGKHLTDLFHPEIAAKHLRAINGVMVSGRPFTSELREVFPEKTCWIDVRLSPVKDASGAIIAVLGLSQDITERKTVEKELRESEERFKRVFDQGPLAIALSEKDFRFSRVNAAFCSLFGFSEPECLNLTFKDITHSEHLGEDRENIAHLTRGEIPLYQTEKRYVKNTGQVIWGALTLSVLRDDEGGFLHYLVMIKDITGQKKMEQELLQVQKLEALGVMAGGIAHDFNNMLAGVFGFMDLARGSVDANAPAAKYLGNAFLAFERAKSLSGQLLTFAKGGAPVKRPLRLEGLLRECCNLAMSGSNIKCTIAVANDLAVVDADEHQLNQVFSNILINARQAMPEGGTIGITAENRPLDGTGGPPLPEGNYVAITIRDEGIGIPEKIINRIFDPFFTTKQQGSGLGLATSYSIVKRHGGHIEASSSPSEGTTFMVVLPASGRTASFTGAAPAEDGALLKGSGRILVMDDDQSIRELTIAVLRAAGYEVIAVPDGTEAVELYRKAMGAGDPFELVILDLTVPGGMGGDKAIDELREIDPNVVAIVSSGYADNAILVDPGAHGFACKIAKPYRTEDLLRTVKKALKKL